MKNKFCHFLLLSVFILGSVSKECLAQVPDNATGRLWRLCKVWGFAKYHRPDNCNVDWNGLLMTAIDSVNASASNSSFNTAVLNMLNAAGPVPHAANPLVNNNAENLNAYFEWTEDTLLSQPVRDFLDSIEVNFRPDSSCVVIKANPQDASYNGWLDFRIDSILNIPGFSYSVESNRLLVFFYYWNIINYFHPDKDLMDQDWDSTLYQFTPQFQQAAGDSSFQLRFLNLVTYIDDSHGFTGSPSINAFLGEYYAKIKIDFIEGKSVVTKVDPTITGITVGDIVKKVNGWDIDLLRDSLRHYTPASNVSSEERDLHDGNLLSGTLSSILQLELEDSTGAVYQASHARSYIYSSYYSWAFSTPLPVYTITDCGYGYVNMGKLLVSQINAMYDSLKYTPAIIFDIRNYPNGTVWQMIKKFYPTATTWALFTEPDPDFPGWYSWHDNQFDAGNFNNGNSYDGKVIILCNEQTQSQAEYTVMALQQCADHYTIGSQTAGADGNISYINLPGSLYTYWTSLGIYYPDTTTAQRVGVQIDTVVKPTIAGIRHGIDEVLLTALDCLNGLDDVVSIAGLSVYPNPASDLIYFSGDFPSDQWQVTVFNITGQKMLSDVIQVQGNSYPSLNVAQLREGLYIASVQDGKGTRYTAKFMVVD